MRLLKGTGAPDEEERFKIYHEIQENSLKYARPSGCELPERRVPKQPITLGRKPMQQKKANLIAPLWAVVCAEQ